MDQKTFKFALNETVGVPSRDGERTGVVVARTDNTQSKQDRYCVRHFDAQGALVEPWYDEDQLS